MEQILSLAYFEVAVCPGPFDGARVSPAKLEALAVENALRIRGWPLPFIDGGRKPIVRHGSWIGQDIESEVMPPASLARVHEWPFPSHVMPALAREAANRMGAVLLGENAPERTRTNARDRGRIATNCN